MRIRLASIFIVLICGAVVGCAPYSKRYQTNLNVVHVPRWVRLSQTDREAIAALIARVEKIETLIGITEHGGKWSAFTGRTGEGRGGTFLDYSAYDLQKQSGQWRVIRRGEGISPMVIRLVLTTPPDERPKGQ